MYEDTEAAYRAACRLLDAIHPGLQKLDTTTGVITQIDNAIVFVKQRVRQQTLEDAAERARHFCCCGEDIATAILDPTMAQKTGAAHEINAIRGDLRKATK